MTKIFNFALNIKGVVGRVEHAKSSDPANPPKKKLERAPTQCEKQPSAVKVRSWRFVCTCDYILENSNCAYPVNPLPDLSLLLPTMLSNGGVQWTRPY